MLNIFLSNSLIFFEIFTKWTKYFLTYHYVQNRMQLDIPISNLPPHLPWKWMTMGHFSTPLALVVDKVTCLTCLQITPELVSKRYTTSIYISWKKIWSIRCEKIMGLFVLLISSRYSLASTFTSLWSFPNRQQSAYFKIKKFMHYSPICFKQANWQTIDEART